jgi:hypothetical protein
VTHHREVKVQSSVSRDWPVSSAAAVGKMLPLYLCNAAHDLISKRRKKINFYE